MAWKGVMQAGQISVRPTCTFLPVRHAGKGACVKRSGL